MKNNKGIAPILIILIIVGVFAAGGGIYYFLLNKTPKPVACTEEAKICSDGSSVGRTGPNCEFSECTGARAGEESVVYCEIDKEHKKGACNCPKGTLSYTTRFITDFGEIQICKQSSMGNITYIGNWKGFYKNEEYGFSVIYPEILTPVLTGNVTLPPDYKTKYNAVKFIPLDRAENLGEKECSYGESGEISMCSADMELGIEFISIDKFLEEAIKSFDPSLLSEEYGFGRKEIVYKIGAEGRGKDYYFIPAENNKTLAMVRFYDSELGPSMTVFGGMLDRLELIGNVDDYYDVFGGSKFDARVDGYLKIYDWEITEGNEAIAAGAKGSTAYFVITEYYDKKFKDSMDRLNYLGYYEGHNINLGALENGKIMGIKWEGSEHSENPEPYIDEETTKKLLNSSKENPISVIISFGVHEIDWGCGNYCNYIDSLKIYNGTF